MHADIGTARSSNFSTCICSSGGCAAFTHPCLKTTILVYSPDLRLPIHTCLEPNGTTPTVFPGRSDALTLGVHGLHGVHVKHANATEDE